MKAFSMNKVVGTFKRRPTGAGDTSSSDPTGDSPEAIASRSVRQFCESGGANATGDEVTFLPPIVDAAESSPAAAAECARLIRKFLGRDYWSKPSYQYNAIMVLRILADNPGMTFTRNLDKKFVDTAKELLRSGRDPSVRQMLMESLDSFENTKAYDEGLTLLIEMWKKEKEKAYKAYGGSMPPAAPVPRTLNAPPFDPHSQNYFARAHSNRRLPDPIELANRLEEARTSAKLLEQVVACTAPSEVLDNDLIKEFADRCLSASRSIQGYMTADNPGPDNDTMESLIDTNEQLQQALNHHQRAVLSARKQLGLNERSNDPSPTAPDIPAAMTRPVPAPPSRPDQPPPPLPGRKAVGSGKGKAAADVWDAPGNVGSSSRSASRTPPQHNTDDADPFRDPQPESSASSSRRVGGASSAAAVADEEPRLAYEPFHPGFGGGSSARDGSSHMPDPVTPVSDDGLYDNDDAYGSTPKKSKPVYRY